MKRDALSEEYYDEVCRVIGDAAVALTEDGHNISRGMIASVLRQTRRKRSDANRDEQKVLEHAIRLIQPD
ncbi:DUF2767 family protein [Pantoea coffeiphila]|uniref:Fumarase D n=1 Tax=Pantoea coffeiphila TaxID=1465635 RepID=A0A2S9ICL5_9GAMM|nr:DUF2767 family protein [Pantoea coffeiphila]PRD15533.1 hypothetical protein CQW29_11040 [Pantoea coffeiphila]